MPLMEKEDPKESIQELSAIFSRANFSMDANNTVDEKQPELTLGSITMPQICMTYRRNLCLVNSI
jgi:hypothetical protein